MERLATVRWHTAAPTSIDEELAVYDDGTAWLVARRPASDRAAVGTFRTDLEEGERAVLAPGDWSVDLLHPPAEEPAATVAGVAARVAGRARSSPHAVARFHGRGVPGGAGGRLTVALAVVGEGARPVAFELDPAGAAVHFSAGGAPVGWVEIPGLATGFVTPEAEGLGGLHRRAMVAPGQMGALTIEARPPAGAGEVAVQVRGWLVEALPDAPERQPFEARTEAAATA